MYRLYNLKSTYVSYIVVNMIDLRIATLEVSLLNKSLYTVYSLYVIYIYIYSSSQSKPMIVVNPDGKSVGGEIGDYMSRNTYFTRYGLK